jgi:hypothetical protein
MTVFEILTVGTLNNTLLSSGVWQVSKGSAASIFCPENMPYITPLVSVSERLSWTHMVAMETFVTSYVFAVRWAFLEKEES